MVLHLIGQMRAFIRMVRLAAAGNGMGPLGSQDRYEELDMKRLVLIGWLVLATMGASARADIQSGLGALDRSDYATALRELTPLAERGDATAQFNLGNIYLYGWGIKKNEVEAAKWFHKAAEQGDAKARKMLAYMYERGVGVEKNPAEAEKWSRKSTEKRSIPAQTGAGGGVFPPNVAREGRNLSREEVGRLEEALKAQPGDLALRTRLLGYYFTKAIRDIGREATLQARRRHILWLIQNQPGTESAHMSEVTLDPTGHALADRVGYDLAKALWLKQVEAHKGEPRVLLNAADFFKLHDKLLAEDLLKKGQTLHPQDPGWDARRGYLYGLGILGIDALNQNGIPTSVNPAEQEGPFAQKALKEVEVSTRPVLVGATGMILSQYGLMIRAMRLSKRDYGELAEKLLLKAQSLDPGNMAWHQALGEYYSHMRMAASSPEAKAQWSRKSLEQMEKAGQAKTSESDRIHLLADLSRAAFEAGEPAKAEKYAKELLVIADRHRGEESFGPAVHYGNIILGRLALKDSNVELAKSHLIKAGQTPGGGTLTSFGPSMSLAKGLLEKGEKDTVIQYLELCKKFWTYPQNPLDNWIQTIKAGGIPQFGFLQDK